jgi:hypothetical protein
MMANTVSLSIIARIPARSPAPATLRAFIIKPLDLCVSAMMATLILMQAMLSAASLEIPAQRLIVRHFLHASTLNLEVGSASAMRDTKNTSINPIRRSAGRSTFASGWRTIIVTRTRRASSKGRTFSAARAMLAMRRI